MIRIPTHRTPTHPGEMLLEEFLRPMRLTQKELAVALVFSIIRCTSALNWSGSGNGEGGKSGKSAGHMEQRAKM